MNKDYAKKRRSRVNKRSNATQLYLMPSWVWLVLGAFLGTGLSIGLYWKTISTRPHASSDVTIAIRTPEGKTVSKTLVKSSFSNKGERRFDFYNLLPNLAQEGAEQSTVSEKQSESEKVEKLTSDKNTGYIIQAGSFRLLAQAEELKAQLAMSGFEASIQTYTINQKDLRYRVYVGPFTDKSLALASQQKLEEAYSLHSLIIKNRV